MIQTLNRVSYKELTPERIQEIFSKRKPVLIDGMYPEQTKAQHIFSNRTFEVVDENEAPNLNHTIFNQQSNKCKSYDEIKKHALAHSGTKFFGLEVTTNNQEPIYTLPDHWQSLGSTDINSCFFFGADTFTHLHFDADYRSFLLHQIEGQKRVVLFSEDESHKLLPVLAQSWFNLENYTEEEKTSFLNFANAYDYTLEAGETIFIPTLYWHYVEYLGYSCSTTFRFGANEETQFFRKQVHADAYIQYVIAKLLHTQQLHKIKTMAENILNSTPTPQERYEKIGAMFKVLYQKICTHKPYYVSEIDVLVHHNSGAKSLAIEPYQ